MQLNQEIFQKDKSCDNQNALEILEYFENNNLKAQLQAKDTTIRKLKEHIKSIRENDKEEKVKQDMDEIDTINIELEHSVAKLLSENELLHKEIEHLKKIYKDQFDSIKKTRALSKEHSDSLIAQLNSKSMENANLKGQIQEKSMVFSSIKHQIKLISFSKIKSYSSSTGLKIKKTKSSLKKIIAFADEGNSNFDTNKIRARMDAMSIKMDAQYKELQSCAKQPTLDLDDDDIPMSREEEAKFMQTFCKTRFYNDYRDRDLNRDNWRSSGRNDYN
ncbi:hypothetical protein Tco_0408758 [Tanacetum coccineum]